MGEAGTSPQLAVPVRVRTHGMFPPGTGEEAQRVLAALVAEAGVPVEQVRVRLSVHRDPAVHFPVVAQASADLDGRPVRALVHAATAREAIPALRDRLRAQLARCSAGWERSRGPGPAGTAPHPWVASFPRPPEQRQVMRYKPCHPALLTVTGAVEEMERRDYDFHLFTEVGSEQDSVVYRAGPGRYRITQVLPAPERIAPHTVSLTWYDRPAPVLCTAEAAEWLGMCEVPFLFFRNADSGRGNVLYRRCDGHYGLLCPPGRDGGADRPGAEVVARLPVPRSMPQ